MGEKNLKVGQIPRNAEQHQSLTADSYRLLYCLGTLVRPYVKMNCAETGST